MTISLHEHIRVHQPPTHCMVRMASAAVVAREPGRCWTDRRPYPSIVLPGTTVTATQRDALAAMLKCAPA